MSIVDGQKVRALESNAAWQSKTEDNTITGVQTLSAPGSGAPIPDEQQAINDLISDVGTLETAVLAAQSDISDLQTLSGVPDDSTDLGTFTGTTIPDNSTIKEALQSLETEVELKEDAANKGVAGGYAPLDGSAKIPASYLPTSAFTFEGLWDASTNTPTLADGVGDTGDVYKVSVAGTQDLGSGSISYSVGDELYYNGSEWEKLGASSGVTSVNGFSGVVVLDTDDISEGATNLYYTDTRFDTRFGTKSISDLSDVDTTGVAALNFLRRNAGNTAWEDFDVNQYQDDSTSGSNTTLSTLSDNILKRLTNASLVSVDMIPAGYGQQRFILLNKTGTAIQINNLTGATAANQIITGTGATLTLNDNKSLWLIYDSVATKWTVVGGTGASESDSSNYITGPDVNAELNNYTWDTYADAAGVDPVDADGGTPNIVLSRTSVGAEVLSGSYSFKLSKDAADRQGEGVRVPVTTDNKLKGRPVRVSFDYSASANFVYGTGSVASDLKPVLVDVTSGAVIQMYPNWLDGSGKYIGTVQISSNTSFRLAFHVQTTNASAWDFFYDNIRFEENVSSFIPLDSDSVDVSSLVSFTGFGTAASINVKAQRMGDKLRFFGEFESGTPTATEARISLPYSLFVDSKIDSTTEACGEWFSTQASAFSGSILITGSQNYIKFGIQTGAAAGLTAQNGSSIITAGNRISFECFVLIQGWTTGFLTPNLVGQNTPENLRAAKNATQSLTTATTTKIVWQTVTHDSAGGWDSTNNRYVVKTPGKFDITAQLQYAANATGYRDIHLYKNGSSIYTAQATGSSSGAFDLILGINPPSIDMVPGDYFEIFATQTSGGGLNVVNGNYTFFGVKKFETPQASMNIRKVAFLWDEKAANTAGGTFTSGAFQTRTLNTKNDPYGIVSLSANQFTLSAGTYRIKASAPAYKVDKHKAKIRNITDSSDAIQGSSEQTAAGDAVHTRSFAENIITITGTKVFELQHRAETTRATDGYGQASNFGVVEVYAQLEIEKLL